METYCLKCKKKILKIQTLKFLKQKMVDYLCNQNVVIVEQKKSRFMKEQEAKGLLSNLGIKTSLSNIPLLNVLF